MRYLEWDGLLILPCSRLSSDMPSAIGNRVRAAAVTTTVIRSLRANHRRGRNSY